MRTDIKDALRGVFDHAVEGVRRYPTFMDTQNRYATDPRGQTNARSGPREITDHRVNPANDVLTLTAVDHAGSGGANHVYKIHGAAPEPTIIKFQDGPIAEVGVNGLTHEVLLAIIQDRLEAYQEGPYACEENGRALEGVREAQHWLQFRTLKRMARGVEGTHAT